MKRNLTLTNETLSNNANQSVLTIITHRRDMKIGNHEIMKFILKGLSLRLRLSFRSIFTLKGINGRMF